MFYFHCILWQQILKILFPKYALLMKIINVKGKSSTPLTCINVHSWLKIVELFWVLEFFFLNSFFFHRRQVNYCKLLFMAFSQVLFFSGLTECHSYSIGSIFFSLLAKEVCQADITTYALEVQRNVYDGHKMFYLF